MSTQSQRRGTSLTYIERGPVRDVDLEIGIQAFQERRGESLYDHVCGYAVHQQFVELGAQCEQSGGVSAGRGLVLAPVLTSVDSARR